MNFIPAGSARLQIRFEPGELPVLARGVPVFTVHLGSVPIAVAIHPRTAWRLDGHRGGALLEGDLVEQDGRLALADAVMTLFRARPKAKAKPARAQPTEALG